MKKYKLLKDYNTPNRFIPAGTILTFEDGANFGTYDSGKLGVVESPIHTTSLSAGGPMWFEEVETTHQDRQGCCWKDVLNTIRKASYVCLPLSETDIIGVLQKDFMVFQKSNMQHTIMQYHGDIKLITVEIPEGCVMRTNTSVPGQAYITVVKK